MNEEQQELLNEALHRGKNVKLGSPFRTPGGPKKFAVYVKTPGGGVKKVTFGDPNLRVKNANKATIKKLKVMNNLDKKYKDPFLGEIDLIKVGETSMDLIGESVVHTIYTDRFNGHYYIDTWATTGGDPIPTKIIPRRVIDKIVQIENERLPNGK